METGDEYELLQIGHSVAASRRMRVDVWKRAEEDGPAIALEDMAVVSAGVDAR
jgi:hypothetical protein